MPPPLTDTRRTRTLVAVVSITTLVLILALWPSTVRSHAVSMFGTLRAPGDPAFVAGHRGDRSQAPENTLPAVEHALAGNMAFVEVDVRITADGIPVLMHDETVDRTTNGTGAVADLTLAELRTLDAGSWYSAKFAGTTVPTLDEFLDLFADSRTKALIELKGVWTTEHAGVVGDLIKAHAVGDRTSVASFESETLVAMAEAAPEVPRLVLARELPDDPIAEVHRHHAIGLITNPKALAAAPETVDLVHEAGLGILLYTLNEQSSWAEALAMGVDGIITDVPSDLDGWLASTAPGT